MSTIPSEVLSERFQKHLKGRRLKAAVFLTYCLDPGFFEQEVLPVFLDVALSGVTVARLLQLETALLDAGSDVAVYYDRNALEPGAQSPKFHVRYFGLRREHGFVFHPKVVLAVVQDLEPNSQGVFGQHLVVASMSANLTRAGWWENVEAAHIEEIPERARTMLRGDLLDLVRRLRSQAEPDAQHTALDAIREFVVETEQRVQAVSKDGTLHPRLYSGDGGALRFLEENLGERAAGINLEIISPYFDDTTAKPLEALLESFRPRETRVFVPMNRKGEALCSESFSQALRALGAKWGALPDALLSRGGDSCTEPRFVHAKVYRFFSGTRKYEAVFVGSVNLTSAAHVKGRNFESGFLIERQLDRAPSWWLTTSDDPVSFEGVQSDTESLSALTALCIKFDWQSTRAWAMWDGEEPPVSVTLDGGGVPLFSLTLERSGEWVALAEEHAKRLEQLLQSTSFVTASADGFDPTLLLVWEEGMPQKPSLLFTLSATDILRYWAQLTTEQRMAFLERRGREIEAAAKELGIDVPVKPAAPDSVFSRFAGIYHSFGALEREVRESIADRKWLNVEFRLFGRRFDSLGSLLEKVETDDTGLGTVERYVLALCAKQLLTEVAKTPSTDRKTAAAYEELGDRYRPQFRSVGERVDRLIDALRPKAVGDSAEMVEFTVWFERHFLTRATRTEGTA